LSRTGVPPADNKLINHGSTQADGYLTLLIESEIMRSCRVQSYLVMNLIVYCCQGHGAGSHANHALVQLYRYTDSEALAWRRGLRPPTFLTELLLKRMSSWVAFTVALWIAQATARRASRTILGGAITACCSQSA